MLGIKVEDTKYSSFYQCQRLSYFLNVRVIRDNYRSIFYHL